MNKPNWKDAPEWASYLAQDSNGGWHWFDSEPEPDIEHIYPHWAPVYGKCDWAQISEDDWLETLERRP